MMKISEFANRADLDKVAQNDNLTKIYVVCPLNLDSNSQYNIAKVKHFF